MRTIAIGAIAIALLAAACASPTSVDDEAVQAGEPPVATSPAATSSVSVSPETTSPATTSPVATSLPTKLHVPPSGESAAPSDDQDDGSEPTGQEPIETTQPPKETPTVPIQPVEPHPSGPVAAAVADLATLLGIDESRVRLVSQDAITWPDGSLGCPQLGMEYTQTLVSGLRIVFEAGGTTYEYHSGGGNPFYCPNPTAPSSGDYGDV